MNKFKFVYVDMDNALHEFDPKTGEGPIITADCRDRALCDASEVAEHGPAQGVVRAYLGVDKHWHFDRYITTGERKALGLFANSAERVAWRKG